MPLHRLGSPPDREIGVTIHEQEPVATPSLECEQVAEQDRHCPPSTTGDSPRSITSPTTSASACEYPAMPVAFSVGVAESRSKSYGVCGATRPA